MSRDCHDVLVLGHFWLFLLLYRKYFQSPDNHSKIIVSLSAVCFCFLNFCCSVSVVLHGSQHLRGSISQIKTKKSPVHVSLSTSIYVKVGWWKGWGTARIAVCACVRIGQVHVGDLTILRLFRIDHFNFLRLQWKINMASKHTVLPTDFRVGFIGAGKMALALSSGFVRSGIVSWHICVERKLNTRCFPWLWGPSGGVVCDFFRCWVLILVQTLSIDKQVIVRPNSNIRVIWRVADVYLYLVRNWNRF